MEHEIKIIPDQKLAIINYKGPIEDLEKIFQKNVFDIQFHIGSIADFWQK